MSFVFLGSLLVGLLLTVYTMLTGVERPRAGAGIVPARSVIGALVVATFLAAFGMVGYLLLRSAALGVAGAVAIAALVGAVAAAGALALVTKWAVPAALDDEVDERYLLQGTPARVTRAIGADAPGEVRFAAEGGEFVRTARSFDGQPIEADVEVVIDRLEDGVAYVESWAVVEQRL
ncbi:MAG TPA: hypothetical protein VHQ45_10110 [Gemmatimonadaceae bacterium]|jgi:hypothetical protein|nr:hypothetical protein [Gemmatimonadaceae bacterium]